jgi:hypothetical protein
MSVMIFLTFTSLVFCQKKGPLPVNASYTLQYSYLAGNGNVQGTYKVVKSGNALNDELISWNIVVLVGADKREEIRTLTMEIRRGNGQQESIFHLNKGEEILYTFKGDNITPRPIILPSMNDFNPTIRKGQGPILEGETVTLLVNPSKRFDQIDWIWKNGNKGEAVEVEVNRTTTFTVYGEYRGTKFRTREKSVTVNVNRLADVLDLEITGPTSPVADTNAVTLSLNIKKNLFQNDLHWIWKDHQNKVLSRNKTILTIQPDPFIENGLIRVCPSTGQRQFACSSFQIPLQRLPAPSDFSIRYPAKLYTDQSVSIKAESVTRDPNTQWTWTINGRKLNTTTDSITVRPTPGMNVSVFPSLNRRGGMQKQVKLLNVIVRTTLPSEIKGTMRFCGAPTIAESFKIESAILGNESNFWLVMENDREITRFKGNSFSLLPKKTSSYYLTTDKRPDLKLPFTIEVVELPKEKISILGPSQICQGQTILLSLNDLSIEKSLSWKWYKLEGINQNARKFIGYGKSLTDTIESNSTYLVTTEFNGCLLQDKIIHQVKVFDKPSMPQLKYQILKNAKDRISLSVINDSDSKNTYEWSTDNFKTFLVSANHISKYKLKKGPNTFYARYSDECGVVSPIGSITVVAKKYNYFFLNAGINGSDINSNRSYGLTIGNKSWYLRSKISIPFLSKNQFQKTLSGTELQISDQSRVVNYPRSTGTYYVVNGNQAISRFSITSGTLIGTKQIKFYLGGGYGRADILWGLDINNYVGDKKEREIWARNINTSAVGPELDAGIFLKLGVINIMGGGAMIIDSKISKPYSELHLGIGFSTK